MLFKQSLRGLVSSVVFKVIDNLLVPFERVGFICKPERETQDTVNNSWRKEEGPAAVTHTPGVVGKGCQIATLDAPSPRTWLMLFAFTKGSNWQTSGRNLLDLR